MERRSYSKMTRKGQVTIPAEVRKALGLDVGDRVAFVMENGHVRVEPAGSVVERTAGIMKPKGRKVLSARELRRAAEEAIAKETVERSGLK